MIEHYKRVVKRIEDLESRGVEFSNNVVNDKIHISHDGLTKKRLIEEVKEIHKNDPSIVIEFEESRSGEIVIVSELKVTDGILEKNVIYWFRMQNVLKYKPYDYIEHIKGLVRDKKGEI